MNITICSLYLSLSKFITGFKTFLTRGKRRGDMCGKRWLGLRLRREEQSSCWCVCVCVCVCVCNGLSDYIRCGRSGKMLCYSTILTNWAISMKLSLEGQPNGDHLEATFFSNVSF